MKYPAGRLEAASGAVTTPALKLEKKISYHPHRYNSQGGDPMSASKPLLVSEADIATALSKLPGWKLQAGKLHRDYQFTDFVAAFGFMAGAALIAQAMDHHPEWSNVWNTVRIDLATHDAGGVTALDLKLAEAMEELALRQPRK
jgi:4a-hydroxytetrahydrobiopterin dehydratase